MDQSLDQLYEALKDLQESVFGRIAAAYGVPRGDGLERLFGPGQYTGYDDDRLRRRTYPFTFMEAPYYLFATLSLPFGRVRFDTWRITVQPASGQPAHEPVGYLSFEVLLTGGEAGPDVTFRFPQDEGAQRLDKIGPAYMSRFWNYIQNRDTDEHGRKAD